MTTARKILCFSGSGTIVEGVDVVIAKLASGLNSSKDQSLDTLVRVALTLWLETAHMLITWPQTSGLKSQSWNFHVVKFTTATNTFGVIVPYQMELKYTTETKIFVLSDGIRDLYTSCRVQNPPIVVATMKNRQSFAHLPARSQLPLHGRVFSHQPFQRRTS